jgi:hypothetical protein
VPRRGYKGPSAARTALTERGYRRTIRLRETATARLVAVRNSHANLRNEPHWFWLENRGYLSELEGVMWEGVEKFNPVRFCGIYGLGSDIAEALDWVGDRAYCGGRG